MKKENEKKISEFLENFMADVYDHTIFNMLKNSDRFPDDGPEYHEYPVDLTDLIIRAYEQHNSALCCYLAGVRLAEYLENQA